MGVDTISDLFLNKPSSLSLPHLYIFYLFKDETFLALTGFSLLNL